MARPQLEDGHTQLANELFASFMIITHLHTYERALLCDLFCALYGWQKKQKRWHHFETAAMAKVLGVKHSVITRDLDLLIQRKIIRERPNGDGSYAFSKDWECWMEAKRNTSADPLDRLITAGDARFIEWIKSRHNPPKPESQPSQKRTNQFSQPSPSEPIGSRQLAPENQSVLDDMLSRTNQFTESEVIRQDNSLSGNDLDGLSRACAPASEEFRIYSLERETLSSYSPEDLTRCLLEQIGPFVRNILWASRTQEQRNIVASFATDQVRRWLEQKHSPAAVHAALVQFTDLEHLKTRSGWARPIDALLNPRPQKPRPATPTGRQVQSNHPSLKNPYTGNQRLSKAERNSLIHAARRENAKKLFPPGGRDES